MVKERISVHRDQGIHVSLCFVEPLDANGTRGGRKETRGKKERRSSKRSEIEWHSGGGGARGGGIESKVRFLVCSRATRMKINRRYDELVRAFA